MESIFMAQDKFEKEMQDFFTASGYGTIPTDKVSVYKVIHHLIEGLDAHFHEI